MVGEMDVWYVFHNMLSKYHLQSATHIKEHNVSDRASTYFEYHVAQRYVAIRLSLFVCLGTNTSIRKSLLTR